MRRFIVIAAACAVVVVLLVPAAHAENGHCANVRFRSPYTHRQAVARVAVRGGPVSCGTARMLIKQALGGAATAKVIGTTRYWSVGGWRCSSGGDGTITFCMRGPGKVEGTTPTPGGFWPEP
jgi:hypothetical protein